MKRKVFLIVGLLFIAIQFVPVDYNQAEINTEVDFIASETPPNELAVIIKNSCYDCHSNFTRYPWYDKIAPVSWWVQGHVDHGKEELNFSEWANYSVKKKKHKLEEFIEMIEEKEMPLPSYLIMHGDAKLSDNEVNQLKSWIETIKYAE